MLSAYVRRYLRATWTEKKEEERKRRRRRAWEDITSSRPSLRVRAKFTANGN